jgi:GDSL-like Lipase/Acylhydrolase family
VRRFGDKRLHRTYALRARRLRPTVEFVEPDNRWHHVVRTNGDGGMKRWVSISLAISLAISTMFVAGAVSTASAAAGDVITFDDFAVGTVITNQYQSKGVRFGGSVFIANDSAQPTTPVLSGTPLFAGPVSGSFVNPANGLLVTQYGFTVDVGYINNPGSVKITAFDFSAEEITHTFANAEGINHIDVTAAGVSYFRIETVSEEAAGFSIDNFRVKIAPEGVVVNSMASLGDSYSAGEGLLPEKGLRYDCGTDLPIGVFFENTTVNTYDNWSNGTSCDTVTKSTTAPAGYKNRPHEAYQNLCHRHAAAYPNRIRELLGVAGANSLFVACSGAVTANVGEVAGTKASYPASPNGVAGGQLQMTNLSEWTAARGNVAADLITIGIGGNDAGFKDIIVDCIRHDCVGNGTSASTLARIDSVVFPRLVQVFNKLKSDYPTSTIVAFGYPSIIDSTRNCVGIRIGSIGINETERVWAQNELIPHLNQAVADAAGTAGLTYVDITTVTKGHEVCTDDPWINGLRFGNDMLVVGNESFHLNQNGHRKIADWFASKYAAGSQLLFKNPPANPQLRPPPTPSGAISLGSVTATLGQGCGPANCIIPQVCSAACVLQLDGNNFAPNAPLRVTIFSDPIDLGVVTADASGEIHATLAVPHLEPGLHEVEVASLAGNPVNERGSALVGLQTPSYVSQAPVRVLDTRPDGPQVGYSGAKPAAEQTVELAVAGLYGVPDDADAVALNVTATEANGNGFVTVWPCGTDRPLASNLNHTTNQSIPNLVIVKIGVAGKVCLFTQTGTHLIADVQGWYPAGTAFKSQPPTRALDTRPDGPQVGYSGPKPAAAQTIELPIAGVNGVPDFAGTVALNITATEANGNGFVTVWPCGTDRPLASNLNHTTNQTIPNLVIVKIGAGGKVCLFTQTGTHLIADVQGWSID